MNDEIDPVRFEAASNHFRAFFEEVRGAFLERDDVITQVALGLLCREHTLVTGPPGTAKSQLASAVFGRVLDEETGEPSLFARQFTESTVQTDLVGPIDFKTLMATGRTEHFTDEGMLGATHAFLDEVFDGRDNLLRSALNVLHERELKQGTRITKGRIESALMTTNRYISDVLSSSRDTLLAFVDRIAFVGFVPRGFAEPANLAAVLRNQFGGSRGRLEAPLTLQDVDVLQQAVDETEVPPEICDALAKLLDLIDVELREAARADDQFVPTRYLSTRTAVRSGRILKAIALYDHIFKNRSRELVVMPADLEGLRLHLVLCGPSEPETNRLLERETDPNERRQLAIVKTEREIFQRSMRKLGPIAVKSGSRSAKPKQPAEASTSGKTDANSASSASPATSIAKRVRAALESADLATAAVLMRELGDLAAAKGRGGLAAEAWLGEVAREVSAHAATAALGGEVRGGAFLERLEHLEALAGRLESGSVETRGAARWLRGRAVAMIDEALAHRPGASTRALEIAAGGGDDKAAAAEIEARLVAVESLVARRTRLVTSGADLGSARGPAHTAALLAGAALDAEEDVAVLADEGFRATLASALAKADALALEKVIASLVPDLEALDRISARISALSPRRATLKERVVGPRIAGLVEAVVDRIDGGDRLKLAGQVERLIAVLRSADLGRVVPAEAWLTWVGRALLRADEAATRLAPAEAQPSYDGYREARARVPRVTNAFAMAETALRAAPDLAHVAHAPSASGDSASDAAALGAALGDGGNALPGFQLRGIADAVAKLPESLRSALAQQDLARLESDVAYLETFFADLEARERREKTPPKSALTALVKSKFFVVILEDRAPERFALEAGLVAELFLERADDARALVARVRALEERSRSHALALFKLRSNEAWDRALATPSR